MLYVSGSSRAQLNERARVVAGDDSVVTAEGAGNMNPDIARPQSAVPNPANTALHAL